MTPSPDPPSRSGRPGVKIGDLPPASEWTLSFANDFGADECGASFAVYQGLYADFKPRYPYHRDLGRGEFENALSSEDVGKAVIEVGKGRIALPLFGPTAADSWLSESYYNRMERSRSVRVVHFFHLPGFMESPDVCPRGVIQHLATWVGSGTIFSYVVPEEDHNTGIQLRELARMAGLAPEEPEELGTEVYFAGGYRLQNPQKGVRTRELTAAYREILAEEGHAPGDSQNILDFKTVLEDEEIPAWWQVYWQSFGRVEADHPSTQKLKPEVFYSLMQNPSIFKVISCDPAGVPQAMCLLADVMAFPGEMSTPYFRRRYPVASECGQIMCFRGLLSRAQKQAQIRSRHLVRLLVDVGERAGGEWVVTFSTRDRNRRIIPYIVTRSVEGTKKAHLPLEEIGCLGFHAFRIRG